jgi:hypothetical protein
LVGQFRHRPLGGLAPVLRPVPREPRRTLGGVGIDVDGVPVWLLTAACVTGLEGLLVLAYAVVLSTDIHSDRVAMGVTTSLFFGLVAGALIACSWYVVHGRTWARSPIIVTEVLALGLAWNFLGGSTTWLAVVLALFAVLVLVGLLHPASLEALDRDDAA